MIINLKQSASWNGKPPIHIVEYGGLGAGNTGRLILISENPVSDFVKYTAKFPTHKLLAGDPMHTLDRSIGGNVCMVYGSYVKTKYAKTQEYDRNNLLHRGWMKKTLNPDLKIDSNTNVAQAWNLAWDIIGDPKLPVVSSVFQKVVELVVLKKQYYLMFCTNSKHPGIYGEKKRMVLWEKKSTMTLGEAHNRLKMVFRVDDEGVRLLAA